MIDVTMTAVVGLAIILGIVAWKTMNFMSRRKWIEHEEHGFLVEKIGLDRVADRFLHDTRIVRYRGESNGVAVVVESGAGPGTIYARVDFPFPKETGMGVRISSEHEEGLLTRFMRLREIEVGLRHFDSQFILLSRDEERVKDFLDHDLRRMLVVLKRKVRDLRLNDTGLHLQMFGEVDQDDFLEIVRSGAQLAELAFKRAQEAIADSAASVDESAPAFTPVPGTLTAVNDDTLADVSADPTREEE